MFTYNTQVYTNSNVFLALRIIHLHPLSLQSYPKNACKKIQNVLRLTPKYISSTPFPTLLLQSLPTKHHEIYAPYNTVHQAHEVRQG